MSRGFKPDPHRVSQNFYQNNAPLRNHNPNYNDEPPSKTYNNSRQFTQGIFTNELSKRQMKKKQQKIQFPELQIIQILPQNEPPKIKSNSKAYGFNRQSRDYRQSHRQSYRQSTGTGYYNQSLTIQQVNKTVSKEIESLRNEIYNKMFATFQQYSGNFNHNLQEIVNQMNAILFKRQQSYNHLKTQTIKMKQDITNLNHNFVRFNKENDDKIQNLVNEMSLKRSKNHGEYGVDIKSSFQGMNSSISGNFTNENNSSSKLLTQALFQLDNVKKELSQTKMNIQDLNLKMIKTHKQEYNYRQSSNTPPLSATTFNKEQITLLISRLIKQDKRQSKLQEKLEAFDSKFYTLNQILKQQEDNIIGMNDQMKNIFNNQINPKIKKIETGLIDIYSKIDQQVLELQIKKWVQSSMNERLKGSRVLRVRNSNKTQAERLGSINGGNEDKITFKQTYLIDDENYLMDSQGNYLVEQVNGVKKRIKIEQNLIYLLKLKGIEIINCL